MRPGLLALLIAVGVAAPAYAGSAYFDGFKESGGETDWGVEIRAKERHDKIVKVKTLEIMVHAQCYNEDGSFYDDPVIGPLHPFDLQLKVGADRRFEFKDRSQNFDLDFDGRVSKTGKRIKGTLGFQNQAGNGVTCIREPFEYEAKRLA